MTSQPRKLYRKFAVSRVDGRDAPGGDREGARYVVLDVVHCAAARTAALVYADEIAAEYPEAADGIRQLVVDAVESIAIERRATPVQP